MLEVAGLDVFYGNVQALWDVSFRVEEGEIVSLVGANGAGKSTTLKTVAGLLKPRKGKVLLGGMDITGHAPNVLAARGLVLIPEGRQLWPGMTVRENLEMGAYAQSARAERAETFEVVFAMFPRLKERLKQKAGTLSGGEQQMCAIGRGLMARPKLLMLDEPALGLAPLLVREVFACLKTIREQGVTIVLVEQNVSQSLRISNRAYVLETGRMVRTGLETGEVPLSSGGDQLLSDERLKNMLLGI